MKSNTYHNTTNESKSYVKKANKKAESQDAKILKLFHITDHMTASEVLAKWRFRNNNPILLTSCRRALSNLTRDEKLFKTKDKKMSPNGAPEHYYELFDLDKLF